MSDQQNEWWNTPGSTPPAPSTPPPGPMPAPGADPDATVVIPAQHPGAPPVDAGHGGTPAQYAPQQEPSTQPPPPQYGGQPPQFGGQPPQHSGQPPQHSGQPPQYGGPQFVTPSTSDRRYRAPGGSATMIAGALLAILGTFLPWVTFAGESVNGYETYFIGDDFDSIEWSNPGAFVVIAMIVVILAAVVVLAAGRRVATWIIALLAAGLGGLTAVAALGAVGSVLDSTFSSDDLSIGFGVVLCLLGAIISGIGAVVVAAKKS